MQPSIPFDTCSQPLCHTGLTIKIIKQQSYPTGENHQYDGYQFPLCRCMNAPYFQGGPDSQHQSNNPYYESNHNLFTCKVYYWQNNKLQRSAKFFTCFLFNFIISFLYFLFLILYIPYVQNLYQRYQAQTLQKLCIQYSTKNL